MGFYFLCGAEEVVNAMLVFSFFFSFLPFQAEQYSIESPQHSTITFMFFKAHNIHSYWYVELLSRLSSILDRRIVQGRRENRHG